MIFALLLLAMPSNFYIAPSGTVQLTTNAAQGEANFYSFQSNWAPWDVTYDAPKNNATRNVALSYTEPEPVVTTWQGQPVEVWVPMPPDPERNRSSAHRYRSKPRKKNWLERMFQ